MLLTRDFCCISRRLNQPAGTVSQTPRPRCPKRWNSQLHGIKGAQPQQQEAGSSQAGGVYLLVCESHQGRVAQVELALVLLSYSGDCNMIVTLIPKPAGAEQTSPAHGIRVVDNCMLAQSKKQKKLQATGQAEKLRASKQQR
jgi:hypothetical protein